MSGLPLRDLTFDEGSFVKEFIFANDSVGLGFIHFAVADGSN